MIRGFIGVITCLVWAASAGAVELPPILDSGGEGTLTLGGTEPFTAYERETYTFTYEVGPSGLDAGGGFLIPDPILHGIRFTRTADWTLDPQDCNDVFQMGQEPSRYEGLLWAETGDGVPATIERPEHDAFDHQDMYTAVTVEEGLPQGATIRLTVGMTQETPLGPGQPVCATRTPNRAYRHIEFPAASRSNETATWAMLDSPPPVMRISSAPDIGIARVLLPGTAQVGEVIPIRLVLLDPYGNPLEGYAGTANIHSTLQVDGLPLTLELDGSEGGVVVLEGELQEAGVLRVELVGLVPDDVFSNPCLVTVGPPEFNILWGDIHSHHGNSYWDGAEYVDENLDYARDVAGLDFAGESMKLPPLEVDGEQLWENLRVSCESYLEPGFFPVMGFEWMGDMDNGHHNVYFDGCWGDVGLLDDIPDLAGTDGLWAFLDAMAANRPEGRMISVPHATKYTGHEWDAHHDDYRPLAEVFSEWGESMESDGSSAVPDGILAGNTLGFIGSSDNHDGFMGNPMGVFNTRGGLAAALTRGRSREDLFTALQERSTFATAVERMILLVRSDEGGYSASAGEKLVGFEPTITIEVHGTYELRNVSLHRLTLEGTKEHAVVWEQAIGPDILDGQWTVDTTSPDRAFTDYTAFYVHAEQVGDGEAWSSPIYVVPSCDGTTADPAGLCGDDDDDSGGDDDDSGGDDDHHNTSDRHGCGCEQDGRAAPAVVFWVLLLGFGILSRRR